MLQRTVAILLAVFFLGLVVLMASVTYFVRDPLPILGPRTPVEFAHAEGPASIAGRVIVDGGFGFEVSLASDAAAEPPTLVLRNPATGGSPLQPRAEPQVDGTFRATGHFTAPGRWHLDLRHGEHEHEVVFILRE